MTDANLMDAGCIHGEAWYDCEICTEELNELLEKEEFEDGA